MNYINMISSDNQSKISELRNIPTQWTAQNNLKQAATFKQIGNKAFGQKKYKQALRAYHKAILHLNGIIDKKSSMSVYTSNVASDSVSKDCDSLKFNIYLNMSQIYMFQEKYDRGLSVLQKAQGIMVNPKLFYRKGVCKMRLGDFQMAKQCFLRVSQLDGKTNQQLLQVLKQLTQLQKRQNEKSKIFFQKFFK